MAPAPAAANPPNLFWAIVNQPLVWLGLKIVAGLLVIWVGLRVVRLLVDAERRVLLRTHVDPILVEFLRNVSYALLLALIIISALEMTGFPTTSLLTTLGAAGLAVGLALKDSLSHIAAGVVLIVLRPFRVGDRVLIAGQEGIVEGIFIFQTRLHTPDNRELIFMNGQVIAGPIFNYSQRDKRRSDITLTLAHGADLEAALAIAKDALGADARILKQPPPSIGVSDISERGVSLAIQAWSAAGDMDSVRSSMLVALQSKLRERGIELVGAK